MAAESVARRRSQDPSAGVGAVRGAEGLPEGCVCLLDCFPTCVGALVFKAQQGSVFLFMWPNVSHQDRLLEVRDKLGLLKKRKPVCVCVCAHVLFSSSSAAPENRPCVQEASQTLEMKDSK